MTRAFLAPVASASVLTLLSRLLGFLRDALIAHALGAGPAADAFVVAFRLPNLFRRLLAEGVLAQGLVPPLVHAAARGGAVVAARLLRRWLRHATAMGALLLLAGPLLAPWVVAGLAPGLGVAAGPAATEALAEGESSRALAAALLAAMWPYLAVSGVTAVLAAARVLTAASRLSSLAARAVVSRLSSRSRSQLRIGLKISHMVYLVSSG